MLKKLLIIGAGGFGRETLQYVEDINRVERHYEVIGFIDEDREKEGTNYRGIPVIGGFAGIDAHGAKLYAVCAVANPFAKEKLCEKAVKAGLKFVNIVHPRSLVGETVKLGTGIIIGPDCVITSDVCIGDHVSINPQCGIGHDTVLNDFSTLYWNVSVGGCVKVGKSVEIGSKAFIKQGLAIGDRGVIGAGAAVIMNVERGAVVAGVPARELRRTVFEA